MKQTIKIPFCGKLVEATYDRDALQDNLDLFNEPWATKALKQLRKNRWVTDLERSLNDSLALYMKKHPNYPLKTIVMKPFASFNEEEYTKFDIKIQVLPQGVYLWVNQGALDQGDPSWGWMRAKVPGMIV